MLAASNLTVRGRLDGVSAILRPGEITAICGPNGAGKSSLLQCLAGLLPPDRGEILLEDRALSLLDPRQRAQAIGYLPQSGEIAWDVSVRNLVALGRLPHRDRGEGTGRRRVGCAGPRSAFNSSRQYPVWRRKRARLARPRVLAGEPRWILADEPLAALDLGHQLALIGHLRRVARTGTGVVLVLHDLALAMNHADRVLVLDRGHVAADGPPEPALSPELVERVWGVAVRWLGEPGARALITAQNS